MEQTLSSLVAIASPILRYAASHLFQALRREVEQRTTQRSPMEGGPAARYAERIGQGQRSAEQAASTIAEETQSEGATAEAVIQAAEDAPRGFESPAENERHAEASPSMWWAQREFKPTSVPAATRCTPTAVQSSTTSNVTTFAHGTTTHCRQSAYSG